MRKGRYEEIIQHANNIASMQVRLAYIEGAVETDDLDHTDYNDRVIAFKKELIRELAKANKQKQ